MDAGRSAKVPEVRAQLDAFEEALEHLRVSYEKYFVGIDKVAPVRELEKIRRTLRLLERQPIRSTALRFRFGELRARLTTYSHYWTRVERELERGISRRDLLRIRSAAAPRLPTPAPTADAVDEPDTVETVEPSKAAPPLHRAPPEPAAKPKGPPPPPPPVPGLDPTHLREVFQELLRAKQAVGESTDGLTYPKMYRQLAREAPKLLERHKCDRVRFEVSTVDGRVLIRARPG